MNFLLGGLLAVAAADTLWLQNAGMQLGFDSSNGSLLALTDRASGQSFVDGRAAGIWRLDRFGPGDLRVVPSSARRFSWSELAGERPGLALVWSDFGLDEAPALRVTATVRLLGDSGLSEWRIVVDSPGAMAIEQVRFPRLAGIPPLGRGEELAVPRWMGALARDPATLLAGPDGKGRRLEWAYPGTVFFEATTVSEGRGSDLPFEQIGAPWLRNTEVVAAMNAMNLPGIRFEAVEFPTAETARKYPGQMLKGVRFTLTDRASYRPLATSLVMIDLIRRLHPDQFQWAGATLERHGGSARLRQAIEGGTLAELLREWERDQATFRKKRAPYLIYR